MKICFTELFHHRNDDLLPVNWLRDHWQVPSAAAAAEHNSDCLQWLIDA